MAYLLILLSMLAMNLYPMWLQGDPAREGKLCLFLFAAIIPAAIWIGRRLNGYLGLAYLSYAGLWIWFDAESYGALAVYGPLAFLALAAEISVRPKLFYFSIRVSMWVQFAFLALNCAGRNPLGTFEGMIGTMGNNTMLGAVLAGMLPVAMGMGWPVEVILICAAVGLSGSTMSVVTVAAVVLAYAWKCGKEGFAIVGVLALIALGCAALSQGFGGEFMSLSGRMMVWPIALEQWASRPFGWGPGAWLGLYPIWGIDHSHVWGQVHSEPIQTLLEGGGQTFVLLGVGLALVLYRAEKIEFAGMIGLLVNSLGSFTFHFPPTAFLFCAYMAIATNKENPNGRRTEAGSALRRWWGSLMDKARSLDEPPREPKNSL